MGKRKYDPHSGRGEWLKRVHATKLANLTPQKIQQWKRSFLSSASPDPISQRAAKTTLNSYLRQACSLFSPRILKHLTDIVPPDPLPFADVEFESRQSLKYRTTFDVEALIGRAMDELSRTDPEAFKAFLLAVMVGLRRKEIDLLEWDSFLWDAAIVRVQATRHFAGKTEDSLGDVAVDAELLELCRGYRPRATSAFVIESDGQPRPASNYVHYRCKEVFERLIAWLRRSGVNGNRPLHTLRKEFGSQICAAHGIHAASRQLRHADIAITNMFYTDARKRAPTGLGHLLKSDDTVVPLVPDQCGPRRTGDSLALGGS
jgi:integrase